MPLSLHDLQINLSSRSFKYFDQVESIQDIAFEWLREGADVGSAVIVDELLDRLVKADQ